MARETVIKKVEKRKTIGAGMMFIGVMIVVVAIIFGLLLEPTAAALVLPAAHITMPPPDFSLSPFSFPSSQRLWIAVVLAIVIMALLYALVAALTGRDPQGPDAINGVMAGINERKLYNRTKAKKRW